MSCAARSAQHAPAGAWQAASGSQHCRPAEHGAHWVRLAYREAVISTYSVGVSPSAADAVLSGGVLVRMPVTSSCPGAGCSQIGLLLTAHMTSAAAAMSTQAPGAAGCTQAAGVPAISCRELAALTGGGHCAAPHSPAKPGGGGHVQGLRRAQTHHSAAQGQRGQPVRAAGRWHSQARAAHADQDRLVPRQRGAGHRRSLAGP